MRPIHAIVAVALFFAAVLAADFAFEGGFAYSGYERVSPDRQGELRIPIGDLQNGDVRFFRFLNSGNQEVKFFLGRDTDGHVHAAFDANEICYKMGRGYAYQDGWLQCRKCDKNFELNAVNQGGGGCKPVPMKHSVVGDTVLLRESDILAGWRYFR